MPNRGVMRWLCLSLFVLCLAGGVSATPDVPQRPPRIDDRFEEETVRFFTFAPDGEAIAFVRRRPANSQLTNGLQMPEVRDDVWVQEGPGQPVKNITHGAVDSSGWWAPRWSPSGRRLALLSTRGGNIAVWVWDRGTARVRQVSTEGVEFQRGPSVRWINDQQILALVVPEGERSTPLGNGGYAVGKGVEYATAAWAKAARGEVTARPIHSVKMLQARCRLVLMDLARETVRRLAATQVETLAGQEDSWWPSPDGEASVVRRVSASPFSIMPRYVMGFPAPIDLVGLDGEPLPLNQPLPANVVTSTLTWSPDGKALAFFALGDSLVHPDLVFGRAAKEVEYPAVASKEYPGRLWRVDLRSRVVERVDTGDVDLGQAARPPVFFWTAFGEFVFRAPRLVNGARPVTPSPSEWLVLGPGGRVRPFVKTAAKLPRALQPIEGGAAFVGLADGDVWSVDVAQGTIKNLTISIEPKIESFQTGGDTGAVPYLLVTTVNERSPTADSSTADRSSRDVGPASDAGADYVVDVRSGGSVRLARPGPGAKVVAFSPRSRTVVFSRQSQSEGTFAWRRAATTQASERLAEVNTFLRRIAQFDARVIEYTGLNGRRLKARITLPLGYQAGRRYPLVVETDTGVTPSASPRAFEQTRDDEGPALSNNEMFAAAGYMYMQPSMPTDGMDNVGRMNVLANTDGILPALDKAVEAGLADPDRLFLYGGSSMGNAVLGLVTQTSRFRAAVAAWAWSDQIVKNLEINFIRRYTDSAFDFAPFAPYYSDIDLPFWRNAEHERRNSPLSYVDRIRTPLMIVSGEMDTIAPASTEMFFTALVQQRKPALYVHYWGEGHGLRTPANARDFWQRMLAWFDEHGDITRDAKGGLVFENDRVESRGARLPLTPEDFARFGPAAHVASGNSVSEPQD